MTVIQPFSVAHVAARAVGTPRALVKTTQGGEVDVETETITMHR